MNTKQSIGRTFMKSRKDGKGKTRHGRRSPGEPLKPQAPSAKRLSPAEAASFQEQEKYGLLAESAPLGIAVIGGTGRYHYLNPKFVDMFGYTLEDIPTGREWFARAYPDVAYRDQVISDWKLYLKNSQAGETEPRIFTVTCKDGSSKVIKFRAVPLEGGKQLVLYEDITEYQEAEAARGEAEELFRVLYEVAADAFFLHENGKILQVNQQTCDSLGYSREELLGMTIGDIEVGLNSEEMAALWQKSCLPPETILGIHRRKDGSTFPVEVRASNFDYRGRRLRLSLARDITERLQAEAALRESELKYRTLVEQIPAITYMTSKDDFITTTFISPQVECILGFTPADFEAEPYTWADHLHHEDRDRVFSKAVQCLETGKPLTVEYRMLARDGRVVWIRDQAQVVKDESGRHLFLQGVMLNITEHKELEVALHESEAHYRTLFETSPDAILLYDADLKLTMANQAAATLYGLERPEEMVGLSAFEFLAPESLTWARKLDQERTASENFIEAEFTLLRKDGSSFIAETRTSILRNPDGSPQAFLAVAKDITERKRAEEKLVQAQEEWERTFNAISDLVMILDEQHRIVRANRALAHKFGYEPEEMEGKFCYQALYGLETICSHCPNISLLADGKSAKRELWDEKLQGHFLLSLSPIFDSFGKIIGSVQVGTDITERRRANEALRKSEERYRLIAENVNDVIWTTDLDLRFTYVSPSIQQLLGFVPEEMLGRTIGEFLPPTSLARALEVLSEEMAKEELGSLDPKRYRVLELEEVHKNGSLIRTEVKAGFMRDANNQPRGILGVTRDITERKAAEDALRRREAILEAVSFGAEKFLNTRFWEHDIQEVLERLGPAVEVSRIYIFENHADKNGTPLVSLRHEWVAANIEPQIDYPEFQETSYEAAGFERWAEVLPQGQIICGCVRDFPPSEKKLLEAVGIKSLITVPIFVGQQWWGGIGFEDCFQEREWSSMEIDALLTAASILGLTILHHQEERALRESEEKLRSLSYQLLTAQEQERKRLASELHHVLGHDLLLLKLKLESLQEELGAKHLAQGKKVHQVVRALQDSVRNVRRLCQDLTPGDLEDLGLTTALHLLVENFALARKLTWQAELDELDDLFDLPGQTAIYRMVQEALTNVGKHARAKHLWLRARRAGTEATFVIEDDGRGFDAAEALASKKTLGLLGMEERVKILGGSFDIVSREQAGTRITFTIPIVKHEEPQ
jgi:PAS domain S-box-containing protein